MVLLIQGTAKVIHTDPLTIDDGCTKQDLMYPRLLHFMVNLR